MPGRARSRRGRIHDLIVFNWRHAFGDMASKWTDEELAAVLARIPSEERRRSWLRVARRPYTEEERAAARGRLVALLGRMEAALAPSGWLVGGAYSIADIAAVPFVKRIEEEIAPDQVTREKHPLVAEWWSRIQARPAFGRADIGPFTDRPVAP